MADALAVHDLRKRYGANEALKGVDLTVGEGELVGLLGPERRRQVDAREDRCGLVRATSGSAQVSGAPAGTATANRSLGYLAELFRFPDWLSADELLLLHQKLAGSHGGRGRAARAARAGRARRGAATGASARCRRACSSGSGSRRR